MVCQHLHIYIFCHPFSLAFDGLAASTVIIIVLISQQMLTLSSKKEQWVLRITYWLSPFPKRKVCSPSFDTLCSKPPPSLGRPWRSYVLSKLVSCEQKHVPAGIVSRGLHCCLQHVFLFCSAQLSIEEFLCCRIMGEHCWREGELGFGGNAEAQLGVAFVLLLTGLVEEKLSLMLVLKAKEKSVLKAKKNLHVLQN